MLDRHPAAHSTADRVPRRPPRWSGHQRDYYRRLAHLLLHDPGIASVDRVACSFVLLYGQQLSRIAAMTRDQVHDRGDTLSIRFGIADVEITEPLAGFVRVHLDAPRRHTSLAAPPESNWLFPGHLPGRPITPARLVDASPSSA